MKLLDSIHEAGAGATCLITLAAVAAARSATCPVPMAFLGMDDTFGQFGDPADLMPYYHMTDAGTVRTVRGVYI